MRTGMRDGCVTLEKLPLRTNLYQDRCALWEEIRQDEISSGNTQVHYTSLAHTNRVFDFGGSDEGVPLDVTALFGHRIRKEITR